MTTYTVYDLATGDIMRAGFVLIASDALLQAGDGEGCLVGVKGNVATERVDIEATPPVLVAK